MVHGNKIMKRTIFACTIAIFILCVFSNPALAKSKKKIISQAEQGDAQAQYELATMYENGKGAEQNVVKALEWFNKAAENGHLGSMIDLGWFYQNGQYVEKDINKAIEWYEKAAEQGSSQAQVNIAVIYDQGVDVPENNELAVEWYKKAADQGHDTALLNLGINYWKGEGVEQNYEQAWNLLNRVRMTTRNKKAQWAARGALDEIKGELGIKNGEFSYPAWDKLKRK